MTTTWTPTDIAFVGSTEAVYTTYTGHDGFPMEPVVEYLPIVFAHNPYGDRKGCYISDVARPACLIHEVEDMADRCAAALRVRAARGELPVGFLTGAHWHTARPVYGSQAFVDYGQMDDIATEAREDADERI
jgi:hypothetical protein